MAADPTTVPDVDVEDEQYDSEEDEDFQLDDAAGGNDDDDSSSDSDDETGPGEPATKKRKAGKRQDAADEELGSGDEATIQKAKTKKAKGKKQKKSGAKGDDEDDEDDVDFDDDEEGGAGGFVRTRAMKMRTYVFFGLLMMDWIKGMLMLIFSVISDRKSENLLRRSTERQSTSMPCGPK